MPPTPLTRLTLLAVLIFLFPPQSVGAEDGVPVSVVTPQQQPIYRQVQVTGTVTSPRVSQLSPALEGLIQALHAEEGDLVESGQPLLELDPELAQHQLQSARAQVTQADKALNDARRRLREAESVQQKGGIAKTLTETIRTEVEQNRALLQQRQADAKYRQALVDRHRLKAPFRGVISQRLGELGEWVSPGQAVFELVATDNLRLDFAVAEDFLAELTPDVPVQFQLSAIADKSFTGRVKAIVPVTDPGDRTFLLRIVPQSPIEQLIPGMSASATLQLPTRQQGLVVPRDAILRYSDGRTIVWTVSSNGSEKVAREKRVQTGQSFDGQVEIRSGLQPGEQVVVRGNEGLHDGQRVRLVDPINGQ